MTYGLLLLIGAVLYVLFPRDLIPDFLIGWGWIDDLAVLYVLWRYYRRWSRVLRSQDRSDDGGETARDRENRAAQAKPRGAKGPHAVLEVAPGATDEEIRAAYRRLAARYHPDKVQHLGGEFQELAEQRFKEIQAAYDELREKAADRS